MKTALILLALLVVAGAAWVRLAPSDPARWHVDPAGAVPGPGSASTRGCASGATTWG